MKKSELRQLIKEELEANEGIGKTLATAALGAAMMFGSPSAKADTLKNTVPTTQTIDSTQKDASKMYSSILGYLDQHSDQMMKDASDKMGFLSAKKELMKYCEQKRDGKPTNKLSNKQTNKRTNKQTQTKQTNKQTNSAKHHQHTAK